MLSAREPRVRFLFGFFFQFWLLKYFFLRVERVIRGRAAKRKVTIIIKAKAIRVRVVLLPQMLLLLQL